MILSQQYVTVTSLKKSFSDHVPVLTKLVTNEEVPILTKKIVKRSFKQFTKQKWNQSLARKDWTSMTGNSNVDQMVQTFKQNITECLDEVAPIKVTSGRLLMWKIIQQKLTK